MNYCYGLSNKFKKKTPHKITCNKCNFKKNTLGWTKAFQISYRHETDNKGHITNLEADQTGMYELVKLR